MDLSAWGYFFQGELGAAAALAGLLFVSVSMNQQRILQLGRMADRALEALIILLLVLTVASLFLVPAQPPRLLGAEILVAGATTLAAIIPLQRGYLRSTGPAYLGSSTRVAWFTCLAVTVIAFAGLVVLLLGNGFGVYLLPPGILLSFAAAGINAWVLLIEINR